MSYSSDESSWPVTMQVKKVEKEKKARSLVLQVERPKIETK